MPSAAELAAVPEAVAEAAEGKPEPTIEGANGQLTMAVGGRKPDSSEFKIKGKAVAVEGQFEKGSMVRLEVMVSVNDLHFIDKKDHTGTVVHTTRRHIANVESVRRIAEPTAVIE